MVRRVGFLSLAFAVGWAAGGLCAIAWAAYTVLRETEVMA